MAKAKTTQSNAPDFSAFISSDLQELTEHSFPETQTYFKYSLNDRQNQSPAVFCEAKIRGAKTNTLVRIPDELAERLQYVAGAKTVALVALAEYALDELLRSGKTLVIVNK